MKVTLGGIAKGYAIDRACKTLLDEGIENALVDVGGDMRAIGPKTWKVAIQDPRKEREVIEVINLDNEAVATSGDYRRYYLLGSRRIHHIINPKNRSAGGKFHKCDDNRRKLCISRCSKHWDIRCRGGEGAKNSRLDKCFWPNC